jgi:hypothetical protein
MPSLELASVDWSYVLAVPLIATGVAAELGLLGMGVYALLRQNGRRKDTKRVRARDTATRRGWLTPATIAAALGLAAPAHGLAAQPAATAEAVPAAPASPLVISTDRPSFSDGTGIVPAGHLNLETGYTFTFRDRDGVETQRHNGPEVLARVGLIGDQLELRLATSGYTWSRSDDGAGFAAAAGWNDLTVGLKLKLTDQDGLLPRLAVGVQTTVGAGSDEISSQMAEPTLKLLWSSDLGKAIGTSWNGLTLGGNANVAFTSASGERFVQGQWSVYVSAAVTDKLGVFAEYYGLGPNTKGGGTAHYADAGVTYLLSERVQLDARVGFGLNQEADNMFTGFGVSFLF